MVWTGLLFVEYGNPDLVGSVGMGLREMPGLCLVWVTAACAAGQLTLKYWSQYLETEDEIAAPTWSEHQWAPSSIKELTKSADGSVAIGYKFGNNWGSGRHVDP